MKIISLTKAPLNGEISTRISLPHHASLAARRNHLGPPNLQLNVPRANPLSGGRLKSRPQMGVGLRQVRNPLVGSFLVLLALFLGAQGSAPAAGAPSGDRDMGDIIAQYEQRIVHLSCQNRKGKDVQFGSGFVIEQAGLVATCFHVLRAASSAEATFADGTKFKIKGVRAWDEEGDLAILELADRPTNIVSLALNRGTQRRVGEEVIVIGHPYGFSLPLRSASSAAYTGPLNCPTGPGVRLESWTHVRSVRPGILTLWV